MHQRFLFISPAHVQTWSTGPLNRLYIGCCVLFDYYVKIDPELFFISCSECPDSLECKSVIPSHFRKFTHLLLASHRAGIDVNKGNVPSWNLLPFNILPWWENKVLFPHFVWQVCQKEQNLLSSVLLW